MKEQTCWVRQLRLVYIRDLHYVRHLFVKPPKVCIYNYFTHVLNQKKFMIFGVKFNLKPVGIMAVLKGLSAL
jgi:hypothetical protein